nr:nucleoside hydrolase [Corynebacterium cystitidis]
MSPKNFDCDPGIDDALALGYLAAALITLVGVGSVYGNTESEYAAQNTLDWLSLMGREDVPVALGARNPLLGKFKAAATHIHGETGTGAVELPTAKRTLEEITAAELLVELAHEHAGELEIISVGPMTNIALALALEPELPKYIKQYTLMGGTAYHPGNVSPVAEANVIKDPEAAKLVFEQPWMLTMVGLDVTMTNNFTEAHREALSKSASQSARALAEVLDFYFDFHVGVFGERKSALHDPLAAAIGAGGITPTLAPVVNVEVDATSGPGRGQTICDLRGQYINFPAQEGAHCAVVLEVDKEAPEHLLSALTTLP